MSYLTGPRLHFAGNFTADVSTVNNFVTHFKDPNVPPQPGWNPGGSGSWAINGCKVTSAVFKDGTVARTAADDPVVGISLAQTGRARLVDLDPEQQMVSQIFGLRLRLASATATAVSGDYKVAPFTDIWPFRLAGNGGDFAMSAYYQSLITGIAWGDLLGSRFLTELKQASDPTSLSIKFNVDGFDQTRHVGRIVGTIGPAQASEPAHFIVGRQCMGNMQGPVWYFAAVVDPQRRKLIADFGNALQTTAFGGDFDPTLNLQIGFAVGNQFTSFGRVPIGPPGWYAQTAGVCEFPADRALSDAEMAQLATTPIIVVQSTAAGLSVVAGEGTDGLHVRADDFVYRMSAGDVATPSLRVSRFGQPLPNAQIAVTLDASELQQGGGDPVVETPTNEMQFPATVTTDAKGIAALPLTAGSINNPRGYIDGQVYGVRYKLPQSNPATGGYLNSSDFISVLLWNDIPVPAQPDWNTHIEPILSQYQKLYSVMMQFMDLGSYSSVVEGKDSLQDVFSQPETSPRYMPVTRDLSPAKRNMIVSWLSTTGNAGQPNLGPAPAAAMVAHASEMAAARAGDQSHGKSAAFRARIGATRPQAGFQKRSLQ